MYEITRPRARSLAIHYETRLQADCCRQPSACGIAPRAYRLVLIVRTSLSFSSLINAMAWVHTQGIIIKLHSVLVKRRCIPDVKSKNVEVARKQDYVGQVKV